MTDLRTRFRSYEALPMPATIWADAQRRASAGADGSAAPVPRTMGLRHAAEPGIPVPATRLLVALVVLALLLAAALVAGVGALPRPDRRLGVMLLPATPASSEAGPSAQSPTTTPRATWTVDVKSFVPDMPEVVMPELGERFESVAYHYSIQVPADWLASPARRAWSGEGAWERDMADVFVGTGGEDRHRLTIVEAPIAEDVDQQAWIETHVPAPPELQTTPNHEHCTFRAGGTAILEEGLFPWRHVTYDGRIAWLRRGCGHANVVIFTGARVLALDLFAFGRRVQEVDQQRVFLETIDLDVPVAPAPSGEARRELGA
jgi:hypothetical protein